MVNFSSEEDDEEDGVGDESDGEDSLVEMAKRQMAERRRQMAAEEASGGGSSRGGGVHPRIVMLEVAPLRGHRTMVTMARSQILPRQRRREGVGTTGGWERL